MLYFTRVDHSQWRAWRAGQPERLVKFMQRLALTAMAALGVLTAHLAQAQGTETYEQPPISYSATQPRDALARLQTRLADGEVKLTGSGKEIVRTLLRELHIPVESQLLVF